MDCGLVGIAPAAPEAQCRPLADQMLKSANLGVRFQRCSVGGYQDSRFDTAPYQMVHLFDVLLSISKADLSFFKAIVFRKTFKP